MNFGQLRKWNWFATSTPYDMHEMIGGIRQAGGDMMKVNKYGKRRLKIALTGGPCSGKSTCVAQIAERIRAGPLTTRWKVVVMKREVFTVAEAATFLMSGGIDRRGMSAEQIHHWQEGILEVMLHFESVYEHLAEEETEKHVLIICDRGAMDPKVFSTSGEQWGTILRNLKLTEEGLMGRYDCVIRLHTAPRDYFKRFDSTNIYRRERDYEDATEVDKRYDDAWERHPHYTEIRNPEESLSSGLLVTREGAEWWGHMWGLKFQAVCDAVESEMMRG